MLAANGMLRNQRAFYTSAGGVGLTALTNVLFGLIPVSYLTTLAPRAAAEPVADEPVAEEGED